MQYFVQLTFAPEVAEAVRALQKRVAQAIGIVVDTKLEPHITLGAGEVRNVGALGVALRESLQKQPAFEICLDALGTFGLGSGVLFLSPAYTPELFALYERLYLALEHHTDSLNTLYTPRFWVPHCTLLMNLDKPQLVTGVQRALENWPLPLTVCANCVELCEFPSLEILRSWSLR